MPILMLFRPFFGDAIGLKASFSKFHAFNHIERSGSDFRRFVRSVLWNEFPALEVKRS
ncbi:hypothetical protein M378DRAFT_156551 [Amanita muscaria Koide BX008]|uniref:Uncharacterized protein n=1 Tax=Amanita muscaria (strain Koide BX008) TaxID=946122 RepID=A0A0C2TT01_AMAMK|nr:hypothetical protein M378DRAFT_156551 [Amanita muscaria Koide BX008]